MNMMTQKDAFTYQWYCLQGWACQFLFNPMYWFCILNRFWGKSSGFDVFFCWYWLLFVKSLSFIWTGFWKFCSFRFIKKGMGCVWFKSSVPCEFWRDFEVSWTGFWLLLWMMMFIWVYSGNTGAWYCRRKKYTSVQYRKQESCFSLHFISCEFWVAASEFGIRGGWWCRFLGAWSSEYFPFWLLCEH